MVVILTQPITGKSYIPKAVNIKNERKLEKEEKGKAALDFFVDLNEID